MVQHEEAEREYRWGPAWGAFALVVLGVVLLCFPSVRFLGGAILVGCFLLVASGMQRSIWKGAAARTLARIQTAERVFLLLVAIGVAVLWSRTLRDRASDAIETLQHENAETSSFNVEWLEFRIGQGWPFTKAEYDALPSRPLATPAHVRELLDGLRTVQKTPLVTWHNHPHDVRTGILKLQRSPNEWFYLYVSIMQDPRGQFVQIIALPQGATDPKTGTDYESESLQKTLVDVDPW